MVINPEKLQCFEQCVRDCADALYRVAFRLIGNETLATELVQETYLNAWRSLDSLMDHRKLKSWMFSILRNQYSKLIRKESKAVSTLESPDTEAYEPSSEQQEVQDLVQLALAELDEAHRLPVLLVSMEGLSVEEASEILEIPKGTILSRLHRGRAKLKQILSRELAKT